MNDEPMIKIVSQECIEGNYNRKHIDAKIVKEIKDSKDLMNKVDAGVVLISEYLYKEYYASKQRRINSFNKLKLDLHELVLDMFTGIAYIQEPELFTSVSAQIASRVQLDSMTGNHKDSIHMVAELLAVLCQTDAFDIDSMTNQPNASLGLVSRITLSKELRKFVINSQVLPPMVCSPLELTHNFSSGYLTHNDSLILGSGNHHDGQICLDVLNTMNSVKLKIDTEFVSSFEEVPTKELNTREQRDAWKVLKEQSYEFYKLMMTHGNAFYLTHKVDKRGRIYATGYHITTQGTSFKKAMLELHTEEAVTGVPDGLCIQ